MDKTRVKIKIFILVLVLMIFFGILAYGGYRGDTEPTNNDDGSAYIIMSIVIIMIITSVISITARRRGVQPTYNSFNLNNRPKIKLQPLEKMKSDIRVGKFDERLGPICLNAEKGMHCNFAEKECDEITTQIIIDALGVNQLKFLFEQNNWNYQIIKISIPNPSARGQKEKYALIIKYDKKHGKITDEYIEIIRDDFMALFSDVSKSPSIEDLQRFCLDWEKSLYEGEKVTDIAEKHEEIKNQINNNEVDPAQTRKTYILLGLGVAFTAAMVLVTLFTNK
jgi:hypothetical protein